MRVYCGPQSSTTVKVFDTLTEEGGSLLNHVGTVNRRKCYRFESRNPSLLAIPLAKNVKREPARGRGGPDRTARKANGWFNIGALIVRLGFWGPLHYNHNEEPPKQYWQLFGTLQYLTKYRAAGLAHSFQRKLVGRFGGNLPS